MLPAIGLASLLAVSVSMSPILLAFGLLGCFVIATLFFLLRKPLAAFLVFILILPFHSLLMTVLVAQFGLPANLVRIVASWKESLLILVTLVILWRIVSRQRISVLNWIDGIALIWLFQIVLYFFIGSLIPDWHPSINARIYGLRDWLLYLVPYFIGRLISVSDPDLKRIFKAIILVGVVTSGWGLFEYFLLPTNFHVQIGVPIYFSQVLGLEYPQHLFGLPYNYWAEVAGRSVRRSVSTYLSGQGFALPFLLIIPVVFTFYIRRPIRLNLIILTLCSVALVSTITRITIVVCFIQMLLILVLTRQYKLLSIGILLGTLLFGITLATNPTVRVFVTNTILLQDTSSRARPTQWLEGIQTLGQQPFGAGLGYSGQTGARFGGSGAGQEAGYFKLTGDLGFIGLVLFFSWFGGILIASINLFRTSEDIWKVLGVTVFSTASGFLLNMLTAPPDQSTFVIYIFPFLAGVLSRKYSERHFARRMYREESKTLGGIGLINE